MNRKIVICWAAIVTGLVLVNTLLAFYLRFAIFSSFGSILQIETNEGRILSEIKDDLRNAQKNIQTVQNKDEVEELPPNNLSGLWVKENNADCSRYYLNQVGKTVFWYGEEREENPSWAHVVYGQIQGQELLASYSDIPKGRYRNKGQLKFRLLEPNKLFLYESSGGWPSNTTFVKSSDKPAKAEVPIVPIKRRPINIDVDPIEVEEVYRGHSYRFIPLKKSWHNAKKDSKEKGGYLVSIGDVSENEFVVSLIQKAASKRNEKNPNVWIGLNNDNDNNEWKWESGEPFQYTNWRSNDPNNWRGWESSVCMNYNSNEIGQWFDISSDLKTYYVIEKENPKD